MANIDSQTAEVLLSSIGQASFGRGFYDFWRSLLGFDQCTVWQVLPDQAPLTLVAERPGEAELIQQLCRLYSEQMFSQDPQLIMPEQDISVGLVSVKAMATGDYRRTFFDQVDLQEKAYAVVQRGQSRFYLNFYRRRGQLSFTPEELVVIEQLASFSVYCLDLHLRLLPASERSHAFGAQLLSNFENIFLKLPTQLSAREALCCAYIVTGHSNDAMALIMDVSLNTVRTFRRRAYQKLAISSQNELFAICLAQSP